MILTSGDAKGQRFDASSADYGFRFHTLEFNISESVAARVDSLNFYKTTLIAVLFVGEREPGLVQYVLEPLILC